MASFVKRHLPIFAAIFVLILGGAVAAMAAGSTGGGRSHKHSATHSRRGWRLEQSAASYIGIPVATLQTDLRQGKSLAQIATENGKTEAGLVKALAARAASGLEKRLGKLVKQPGAPGARRRHGGGLRLAATKYLGITRAALRADLKAGKTLAEVADSTEGRSSAGLISALVTAREAQVAAQGTSPKHATKDSSARAARLRERVTAFVDHQHLHHAAHEPTSGA